MIRLCATTHRRPTIGRLFGHISVESHVDPTGLRRHLSWLALSTHDCDKAGSVSVMIGGVG